MSDFSSYFSDFYDFSSSFSDFSDFSDAFSSFSCISKVICLSFSSFSFLIFLALYFLFSIKIASCHTQYPNKILQKRPKRKNGVKIICKNETTIVQQLHPPESKQVDMKVPKPGMKFKMKTVKPWQLERSKSRLFCRNELDYRYHDFVYCRKRLNFTSKVLL